MDNRRMSRRGDVLGAGQIRRRRGKTQSHPKERGKTAITGGADGLSEADGLGAYGKVRFRKSNLSDLPLYVAVSFACLPPMWKVMVCPCNAQSLGDTIRPWYLPLYVLTVSDRHQLTLASIMQPVLGGTPADGYASGVLVEEGRKLSLAQRQRSWRGGSHRHRGGRSRGSRSRRRCGRRLRGRCGSGRRHRRWRRGGSWRSSGPRRGRRRGCVRGYAGVSVGTGVGIGVAVGATVGAGVSVGRGVGVGSSPPHAATTRVNIRSRLKPSLVRFTM